MQIGVLVVDDQADIRLLIQMIIDAANRGLFVCGTAASGSEAMNKFDEADPTVVVLDEMMPGMNGIELAQALRARKPGQLMVLCSAYLDDAMRVRAEAAGVSVCVPKEDVADLPRILHEVAAG